ncbi:MAG TPA: preprotein translocase subunit SecY [Candidatus Nanoarchaeia archaeon]|nr:preprotein translocase subunit SecY [Candidatus Nanoarchaeia archaeon]
MDFKEFLKNLPEVSQPEKKLDFKEKMKWTGVVLVIYFLLSLIPLYGLDANYKSQFETLSVLLAANFGSLISLGIGPIVTASIVLQLLVGADVIKIDTSSHEGRQQFQGMQKLFSIAFILIQNIMYAVSGALPAAGGLASNVAIISVQLVIGSFLVMLLDEVVSKWGIGSGISLFIAAGVSREIFINAVNPLPDPSNPLLPIGNLPKAIMLIFQGLPQEAFWPLFIIGITVVVFMICVYLQSIKVEIPLSFGRFRGFSYRYPLKFVYTSNMPVIFVATLIASMQFWGLTLFNMGIPILGTYESVTSGGQVSQVPNGGLVYYLNPPTIRQIVVQGFTGDQVTSIIVYSLFMIIGAVLFSLLWINIGGQGADNVADQILNSGLNIPGFRRDKRILTKVLDRYIKPLTILGGASVGAVAVVADLFGALSRGTGILLSIMIIFQIYEQIKREHYNELPKQMKDFMKGI